MTSSRSSHRSALVRAHGRNHRSPSRGGSRSNLIQRETSDMELATAHVLTGFYALSHRIALTPGELKLLDESGTALSPDLWHETRKTLELADRGGAGTELKIGFVPVIYAWLGLQDEAEFGDRFGGVGVDEALARDRGSLSAAAASLEGDPSAPLALPVSHAWSARAMRLMEALPETGDLVLLSLERALNGYPCDPEWVRPLFEAIVQVADLIGDEQRSAAGRKMLQRIDRKAAPTERTPFPLGVVTQILTALYSITHEGLLLPAECALEPGIDPSAETWVRIVDAARDGRADDIPAPAQLLRAWGAPEDIEDDAVRDCLHRCASRLPEVVLEIRRLWGGVESMDVSEDVARTVVAMAVIRHQQLQHGFEPLPGTRNSIWFEVHQGVRRTETLERAEIIRRMWTVLLRGEIDPLAVAAVHLDRAGESQALGAHDETRAHLVEVMHWTAQYEGEQHRRDHGAVCIAQYLFLSGNPEEAMRRLRDLEGEQAANILRSLDARGEERDIIREAEEVHGRQGDVHSLRALALAHRAAGHSVRADIVAREYCEAHPDDSLAWGFYSSLLHELGRFRDAVQTARRALANGPDDTSGRALLGRCLSRIGPDGREEATELAVSVLQADDVLAAIAREVLADLVDVAHYGGADSGHTRRADEPIWQYRTETDPPPEWLGAAVFRRCFGVWSEDAPEWLARLADAGADAPAELARFVVERVEGLLWWRSLIERQVEAFAEESRDESSSEWMDEAERKRARREARTEAVGAALRAAISLGYAEPVLDEEFDGSGLESARGWEPHLRTISSCFGDALSIRLCASAQAQAVWSGSEEVGESELLIVATTFDNERVDWIRWAGEHEAFTNLDAISGLTLATRVRLERVLEASEIEDDEEIRGSGWVTRWNEIGQPQ